MSHSSIRILRIIAEDVTTPRNDGTPGSALYQIPFLLSCSPSQVWIDVFLNTWNHPPQYTSMHRAGIASVRRNRILLTGTTIEEVEMCHKDTLELCVQAANNAVAQFQASQQRQLGEEERRRAEHEKKIREIAGRVTFGDDTADD